MGRGILITALVMTVAMSAAAADGAGEVALANTEETAVLESVKRSDQLTPVSVDPSGIVHLPEVGRLLITDSEVDETTHYQNVNLWELTRTLNQTREGLVPGPAERIEPTGLAYDPGTSRLFVSNDQTDSVFIVRAGGDQAFGTGDDQVAEYPTLPFDSHDPADVAYDTRNDTLFVLDFTTRMVHRIDPGRAGTFDGLPPDGDDTVESFSVADSGIFDAEGLGYRASSDTLLVTDSGSDARIFELTTSGRLLRSIDISFLRESGVSLRPSDVAVAPASSGGGSSMYVTDRGEDSGMPNATNEPVDGKIYELSAPFTNLAPVVSAGPDRSLTLSESTTVGGSVVDDGQPSPGSLSVRWSVVEAPGTMTFGDRRSIRTVVSFDEIGTYVLGVEASDGVHSDTDTVTVQVNGSSSGRFVDDDDSIFEDDIEWIAAEGITKGCNPPDNFLFCPKDPVTRGQMAAFLVRALDLAASPGDRFVDDDGSVFQSDIQALAQARITLGCNPPDNDRYCPTDPVTRGQMAAFLVRALDLAGSPGDRFVDDDGSVFEADIQALAQAGITLGCNPPANDRFCPTDEVTREQMAAFLRRALE